MAKEVSMPKGAPKVPELKPGTGYQRYDDLEIEESLYIGELRLFLKRRMGVPTSHKIGEMIYCPAGDGYAAYVVIDTKPFLVAHVPIGDAWRADRVWVRGLRLSDIK